MGEDVLRGILPELRSLSLKACYSSLTPDVYQSHQALSIGAHLNLALITCLSNSFGL